METKIIFNVDEKDVLNHYLNNKHQSILTIDIERDKLINEMKKLVPISTMLIDDINNIDEKIDFCSFNDLHCNYDKYDIIFINDKYNEMIYQFCATFLINS